MLKALFFRLLRLLITSVICSLPIYLGVAEKVTNKGILLLSFIAFVIVTGIDVYHFSFAYYKIRDYYLGQLLPLVIYIVMGFLTCLMFRPFVFNRVFLPLRFAGFFGMRTIESIVVVGIILIVILTALRFFRAKAGRSYRRMRRKRRRLDAEQYGKTKQQTSEGL